MIPLEFLLAFWPPAPQPSGIGEILAKIQANTAQWEQSLPDFVCEETATSKAIVRRKLQQYVNESHFVGRQQKQGRWLFTEARDVYMVNAKPVAHRQTLRGPILFGGGFSSVLHTTFSKQWAADHIYRFGGEETFRGRAVLTIEYATRQGQKDLLWDFYGRAYPQIDTGKAWIDKDSLQVLRIERRYTNVPKGDSFILAAVEYREVRIEGAPFWMPALVTAEQAKGKYGEQGRYTAEYRNYRKFNASSSIIY